MTYNMNKLHTIVGLLYRVQEIDCEDSAQAKAQCEEFIRKGRFNAATKTIAVGIVRLHWDEIKAANDELIEVRK